MYNRPRAPLEAAHKEATPQLHNPGPGLLQLQFADLGTRSR